MQQKSTKPLLNVDELINLAEQAYDQFSPAVAAKYLEDAIKQTKNSKSSPNPLLYHKLGLMYVDCGEPEKAHKAFQDSITVSTEHNNIASNYLYIGQQCYGYDAIKAFKEGIKLMERQINKLNNKTHQEIKPNDDDDNDDDSKINSNDDQHKKKNLDKKILKLKYEISSVYVSIAELFMSDLCQEQNAEIECEKYLNLSFNFYSKNIETLATFAEFKFCQQDRKKSIHYFKECIKTLFDMQSDPKFDDNKIEKDENNLNDKLDIFNENYLSIDSFLKIIKLGIELEEFKICSIICKNLITSNDQIGEIWALGSFCYYKLNKKSDSAIWLSNAESIADIDSTSELNNELKITLETLKNKMDINELPDISKLNLDDNDDDDDDDNDNDYDDDDDDQEINGKNKNNEDINSFLEEDEEDDEDDDIDLTQDNNINESDEDQDIDINNNQMIDID